MAKNKAKAGTSKVSKVDRHKRFVEAMLQNGGNATKAAIAAGYSAKTARSAGSRLLTDVDVRAALEKAHAEVHEKLRDETILTQREVLQSLARDVRFDPAKLYREDGSLKPIHELDEDTRLALRGIETVEEFAGRGDDRKLVGYTKKIKFPEKTAAREQAMKHFGLYELDNKQKPAPVTNVGVLTVPAEALNFEKVRARALKQAV